MSAALGDAWASFKRAVLARYREFRASSRFFQYRAYIAAAYIAVIVLSVIVVVPRSPSNRLRAYVVAARGDFVLGNYLVVRNDSSREWQNITLTLDERYTFTAPALAAGDKLTAPLKKFKSKDGQPPPKDADVKLLRIDTSRGSERYPLSFAR